MIIAPGTSSLAENIDRSLKHVSKRICDKTHIPFCLGNPLTFKVTALICYINIVA